MFGCVPFFPLPRILPFCNVLLRISFAVLPKPNINFTGFRRRMLQEKERKGNTMYIRMSWKEAKEKFDRHEDFVITCGNKSNPYGQHCYYARDYHIGEDNFLTANDRSVNCWKQVPDDVKEPQEGKLFCMKVFDRITQKFATAYVRADDEDLAKLEASYRYYKVVEIEERGM